jgi:hypothetical protein
LIILQCLLPLLAICLVFYVEELLIWPLLCLLLALVSVAPLCSPVVSLELLVLVLLF